MKSPVLIALLSGACLIKAEGLCGNGALDPGEICDPGPPSPVFQSNSDTCEKFGYTGGTIGCNDGCLSANLSDCTWSCGDTVITTAAGEVCGKS
jgi:hypothetical protein